MQDLPLAALLISCEEGEPPDPDVRFANRTAQVMLGLTREEFLARHVCDLCEPKVSAAYRPETVLSTDARLTRRDGSRLRTHLTAIPLSAHPGRPRLSIWLMCHTVHEEGEGSSDAERLAMYRAMLASTLHPVVTIDSYGYIQAASASVRRDFGYTPEELVGQNVRIIMPEPYRSRHDEYLARFRETGRTTVTGVPRRFEARRKDGSIFPVELSVSRVDVPGRDLPLFTSIIRDISQQERHDEEQKLLIRELDHRIKNILSLAATIGHQTLQSSPDPETFLRVFSGRLSAVAYAHSVLTEAGRERFDLGLLLDRITSPFRTREDDPFEIDGDPVSLPARSAQAISLAMHELATNAVKYGALSRPGGKVEIRWRVSDEPPASLTLTWRESEGPPVGAPTRQGFGTRLIHQAIEYELRGTVERRFPPEGVECDVSIPLSGAGADVL